MRRPVSVALLGLLASLTVAPSALADPMGVTVGGTSGSVVGAGDDFFHEISPPPGAQSGVVAVAAGGFHSMALTSAGSVLAWGSNSEGETDVPAAAGTDVTAIAAGGYHSLALKGGGVIGWGDDTYGQSTIPADARTGVTAIAGGRRHSLALKSGGVIGWGDDTYGQISVPPAAQSGITAIAAGGDHSLALTSGGTVVAWGANDFEQSTVPAAATSGVVAIAAGSFHNLALKSDGSVIAWQYNGQGQVRVPAEVSSGVVAISGGRYNSAAVKADGSVIAWGDGGYGQEAITSVTGAVAVSAGYAHTLAVVGAAPRFTADSPPGSATAGTSYSYTFIASGRPAPVFSIASGALPSGLTLNASTGVLSGRPTVAGTYSYAVKASNGLSPNAVSASHALTVVPGAVSSIVPASGAGQSAVTGKTFAYPLVTTVSDAHGNRVPGASVKFSVTTGSANFGGSPSVTVPAASDGTATAPTLTAGGTAGPVTVTASIGSSSTSFIETVVTPGAARADVKTALSLPSRVTRGAMVTATITLSNAGPNDAGKTEASFVAPLGMSLTNAGGGTKIGNSAVFILSSMKPGQSQTYTVTLTAGSFPLVGIAAVGALGQTIDPVLLNNTALQITQITQ